MLHVAALVFSFAPTRAPAQAEAATPATSAARTSAAQVQQAFVEIARTVRPGVVTLRAFARAAIAPAVEAAAHAEAAARAPAKPSGWQAEPETEDYPGFKFYAAGSGFLVDAGGEVLTCLHALEQPGGGLPDLVDVETYDGTRMIAEIVGTEPTVNLALVQCTVFPSGRQPADAPGASRMKALRFGDSDAMESGQWVLGFGDPSGPDKYMGTGTFIARPTRDCYQDQLSAFFLQVALTVPREAYGGPIVNLDGEVIGVLAPRHATPGGGNEPRTGIEYAMPSKIVQGLYQSIRQVRSFQSPWLGFSVMSRAELAAARGIDAFNALEKPRHGILIENVYSPSPAAGAGIQPGDFLTGLDDTSIFAPVDFQKALYLAGVGKRVRLRLCRGTTQFEQELVIQRRPAEATPR
ncbi:MAG TPA: trypsin-like peptidase domain-containing protein [Planctomycetota bacterium]|nr:trypsin-like peptidase domain-containing protein [Planctomycetota bacterium]